MSMGDHVEPQTRREFLRRSVAAASTAAVVSGAGLSGVHAAFANPGAPGPATTTRPEKRPVPPHRVVRVTSSHLMPVRVPRAAVLRECLELGLCDLTDEATPQGAWRRLLDPDDVVLIKFNRSGRERLQTTSTMAPVLVRSLIRAGWSPEQLIVLEAGSTLPDDLKTRPPDFRWQGREVEFGVSGKDVFIAALDQATAIINVPFLKPHPRAVMTSCLKNLSHGLIRHPARFHSNGCDPAIAEIVATPEISGKLRLNIVDAMRVITVRGPDVPDRSIQNFSGILLGTNPAACDAIGFSILNEIRSLREIPPLLAGARVPRQLSSAARLALGEIDVSEIDLRSHAF